MLSTAALTAAATAVQPTTLSDAINSSLSTFPHFKFSVKESSHFSSNLASVTI